MIRLFSEFTLNSLIFLHNLLGIIFAVGFTPLDNFVSNRVNPVG